MKRKGKDRARLEAQRRIELVGLPRDGDLCGVTEWRGERRAPCRRGAGAQTVHEGVGPCKQHYGGSPWENSVGAWMMGHKLAASLDVSPWDALLGEVKRSAGEVAYLDQKVAEAPNDEALLTGGSHYEWKRDRERQRVWLGRVSKMAIDAGVAAMLVARETAAAEQIAAVFNRTIDVLKEAGLSDELESIMRSALRRELLALDSGTTIEATVTT